MVKAAWFGFDTKSCIPRFFTVALKSAIPLPDDATLLLVTTSFVTAGSLPGHRLTRRIFGFTYSLLVADSFIRSIAEPEIVCCGAAVALNETAIKTAGSVNFDHLVIALLLITHLLKLICLIDNPKT